MTANTNPIYNARTSNAAAEPPCTVPMQQQTGMM
jgi:hypothetical protein